MFISAAFGGAPLDAVNKAFPTGEVFLSQAVIEEIDGTIRRLSSKLGEEKTGYLLTLWGRFQSHCRILGPKEKAATRKKYSTGRHYEIRLNRGGRGSPARLIISGHTWG